jgi:hypothetical protein
MQEALSVGGTGRRGAPSLLKASGRLTVQSSGGCHGSLCSRWPSRSRSRWRKPCSRRRVRSPWWRRWFPWWRRLPRGWHACRPRPGRGYACWAIRSCVPAHCKPPGIAHAAVARGVYRNTAYRGAWRGAAYGAAAVGAAAAGAYGYNYYNGCYRDTYGYLVCLNQYLY